MFIVNRRSLQRNPSKRRLRSSSLENEMILEWK